MQTLFFERLPSTQIYLKELVKKGNTSLPLAVVAEIQSEGVGSRENSWVSQKGNLFLSFALQRKELPVDLKLESASIYFSYILQETLASMGSKVFLKWPNDLYIGELKVAGMITNVVADALVCGVGLNLVESGDAFGSLDIKVDTKELLEKYFANIEKNFLWKQVFSKYKLHFQTNQQFFTHIEGVKVSLSEAVLENDGSLTINGERIYSLR